MGIKYTDQSPLFQDFRDISYKNHEVLVHFYEQHQMEIDALPLQEWFIISYYYTDALFNTEAYQRYLKFAAVILEASIVHNFQYVDNIDIYNQTLHKRSLAHLYLQEFDKAQDISQQLLAIAPEHKPYKNLVRKCILLHRPMWLQKCLAIGLVCFFVAAFLSILQILWLGASQDSSANIFWWAQFGSMTIGIGLVLLSLAYHQWQAQCAVQCIITKNSKAQKPL